MAEVQVVLEGRLNGAASRELFDRMSDLMMDALVAAGAHDPFVFADVGAGTLRVEVVIDADSHTEALTAGVQVIDDAIRTATASMADVVLTNPSVQVSDLVAA